MPKNATRALLLDFPNEISGYISIPSIHVSASVTIGWSSLVRTGPHLSWPVTNDSYAPLEGVGIVKLGSLMLVSATPPSNGAIRGHSVPYSTQVAYADTYTCSLALASNSHDISHQVCFYPLAGTLSQLTNCNTKLNQLLKSHLKV